MIEPLWVREELPYVITSRYDPFQVETKLPFDLVLIVSIPENCRNIASAEASLFYQQYY